MKVGIRTKLRSLITNPESNNRNFWILPLARIKKGKQFLFSLSSISLCEFLIPYGFTIPAYFISRWNAPGRFVVLFLITPRFVNRFRPYVYYDRVLIRVYSFLSSSSSSPFPPRRSWIFYDRFTRRYRITTYSDAERRASSNKETQKRYASNKMSSEFCARLLESQREIGFRGVASGRFFVYSRS